ncbi:MAG: membrane protein insertase YidC [Spirochaetaceae bacterium]|jgi:YidC/Oxa1 family membrane protein insertase|nr:membrane protein insertase YidC [Spirochaetaceae bacterium]
MEKKTILAIVISMVVIVAYYFIALVFFPPKTQAEIGGAPTSEQYQSSSADGGSQAVSSGASVATAGAVDAQGTTNRETFSLVPRRVDQISGEEQLFAINTDLFEALFTNAGGDLVSLKLKQHQDGTDSVNMVLHGDREAHAFGIAFGGKEAQIDNSIFQTRQISDTELEFTADYEIRGKPFRLIKKWRFVPDEYMFELVITVDGGASIPELNFQTKNGDFAYTLSIGPQIGPKFTVLDERQDYRHYLVSVNGKVKNQKVALSEDALVDSSISWAAIAGKYFAFIAIPDKTPYNYIFSMDPEKGLSSASRLFIERPPFNASVQSDVFRFYMGPKTARALEIYDTNKSRFGHVDGYDLSAAANASGFWAILNPLEAALKWFLSLFYHLIPNYGVAIILVTLLVKLILFPLTKKGSEGTLRMQAIAPKIKELQEKYKDTPVKLNAEMGALYKKEGYNPLSGCLPMLIQIPIFFAMYNLFNNHFDLRGAIFIPGWIPDLSQPEYIFSFAPFKLPILGWNEIRLLPFMYLGSQLLYGKVTQTPDQAGNKQMKMMLYMMPIVFFFVLYNVPSGLLVYWIMSNVLTMVQQLIINNYLAKRKAEKNEKKEMVKKVIVPPKKRKRR